MSHQSSCVHPCHNTKALYGANKSEYTPEVKQVAILGLTTMKVGSPTFIDFQIKNAQLPSRSKQIYSLNNKMVKDFLKKRLKGKII